MEVSIARFKDKGEKRLNTNQKIELLRGKMQEKQLDAYIVLSQDAHNSEYTPEHWRGRTWLTGFTGSAGTAVVSTSASGLWVDGRYFIQGAKQIEGSEIKLFKMGQPQVPTYGEWLADLLAEGARVGIDGATITHGDYMALANQLAEKNIQLVINYDLLDEIWRDRPQIPAEKIFIHDACYCGMERTEKLECIRAQMKKSNADKYVIEMLDDIAWLTNLRGSDVHANPVFVSYMIVGMDEAVLYTPAGKITADIEKILFASGISLKDYAEFWSDLAALHESSVLLEADRISERIYQSIGEDNRKINGSQIITKPKAIKTEEEIVSFMNSHMKDGVAMVKFLKWLDENKHKKVTEIEASDVLEKYRSEQEAFMGISFDSIAAYGPNAAMMHYKAEPETAAVLEEKSFFLIDSGGQYLDGTTDITRTVAMGALTEEECIDYTLVLKGHIGLARAKFLAGTRGCNLDILARGPLWNFGIDYKCGTGHGVGFFLNVHEGPQSISQKHIDVALEKGMVVTNEPGVYRENKHGIRIENLYFVKKYVETDSGEFFEFEPLTLCPIDLKPVKVEMLSEDEKNWINDYHFTVYNQLEKHLSTEERAWLKTQMPEL